MGSPLSPIIADLYMEHFEQEAIRTSEYKPNLWLRYVDDTFSIWKHGRAKLQVFLTHLNSRRESIKFTMEIESENSLPFLDVKVTRDRNQVHTSVYRKPTHTDRYLNYGSNHHPRIKSGIIKCLAHRARSVCSKDTIRTELDHLQEVFESNAYPPSLVTLNLHTKRNKRSNIVENTEKQPATLATPYVKGLSEKIEKKCKHPNIRTVFSSKRTLRRELVRVKNRVEPTDMKGVVYKIDCSCGQSYIGETGRTLSTRVKERPNNNNK